MGYLIWLLMMATACLAIGINAEVLLQ